MRRISSLFFVLCVVLLSFELIGCGAIFNGSTKMIQVQASPSGTKITSQPPVGEFIAPTTLSLERKNSYVLTFSKEGYKSASTNIQKKAQAGIIVLDVLFTGLIGVVVDAVTGAWNNLTPDQVSISLEKQEGAIIDGPEKIEITLKSGTQDNEKQELIIDSDEPVSVTVQKGK